MGIKDSIRQNIGQLTRKQRLVADYMLLHPDEMAYTTLKDLSRKIGVTEITILNCCQALGYEGFNNVKYEFRKELILSEKTDVLEEKNHYNGRIPSYELSDQEQFLRTVGMEELALSREFLQKLDERRLLSAAKLFFRYKRIVICGRGVSHVAAQILQNYLFYADVFATVINTELNDMTYGMLAGVDRETLVVAISFPDYYFMTTKAAKYAAEAGAKLLVITDRETAEIAACAAEILTVPTVTRCFLNTMTTVSLLLNLLGSALNLLHEAEKEKS